MGYANSVVVGLDVIEHHSRGLADLAATTDPATPVPTCEGWSLGDLVWHLTEVQAFWAHVIGRRPEGPETYDGPVRGVDAGLAAGLRSATATLLEELDGVDPAAYAWSWADDQTVGFTLRRQSHEAIIHHVDGLIAAGRPLPALPDALAADGIDELIDVMICGVPAWATFTPAIEVVRIDTTDTGDRWTFGLGTISGTSTQSGLTYDGALAANRLADGVPADATIRGRSTDLLLWLWGRGNAASIEVTGEAALAEAVRALVVANTQ